MKFEGFSAIEVILVIAIIGILAAVAIPAYQEGQNLNEQYGASNAVVRAEYVICKDDHGEIHQAKGYKIDVRENVVIVRRLDGNNTVFANMDCWTADETTYAPETTSDGG